MATTDEMVKDIEQAFNDIVRRVFPEFCVRTPGYRYFSRGKDRYFWTTETVTHGGKPRYASGIYRYLKTKKQYKLTQPRYHAKRKDAKTRALDLWCDSHKPIDKPQPEGG